MLIDWSLEDLTWDDNVTLRSDSARLTELPYHVLTIFVVGVVATGNRAGVLPLATQNKVEPHDHQHDTISYHHPSQ
jgi:hypothetical protein